MFLLDLLERRDQVALRHAYCEYSQSISVSQAKKELLFSKRAQNVISSLIVPEIITTIWDLQNCVVFTAIHNNLLYSEYSM